MGEIGLTITSAVTVFAKAVARQHRIPFELSSEPDLFWSRENQRHLRRAIKNLKVGNGKEHELIEVESD